MSHTCFFALSTYSIFKFSSYFYLFSEVPIQAKSLKVDTIDLGQLKKKVGDEAQMVCTNFTGEVLSCIFNSPFGAQYGMIKGAR